uniref:Uncharacterized protein n=1 Tax=Arundo donax TaxID=35708 RepID=A0A0A9C3R8_ARUDO
MSQISQQATSRAPAESEVTSLGVHPSSSSSIGSSDGGGGVVDSDDDLDAMIDELIWDPMEDWIEAQIVEELFRGADPEVRRQVAAQEEALRARKGELRREVEGGRVEVRRLREYTKLLQADVSGYWDAQRAEYEQELDRRSKEALRRQLTGDGELVGWLVGLRRRISLAMCNRTISVLSCL